MSENKRLPIGTHKKIMQIWHDDTSVVISHIRHPDLDGWISSSKQTTDNVPFYLVMNAVPTILNFLHLCAVGIVLDDDEDDDDGGSTISIYAHNGEDDLLVYKTGATHMRDLPEWLGLSLRNHSFHIVSSPREAQTGIRKLTISEWRARHLYKPKEQVSDEVDTARTADDDKAKLSTSRSASLRSKTVSVEGLGDAIASVFQPAFAAAGAISELITDEVDASEDDDIVADIKLKLDEDAFEKLRYRLLRAQVIKAEVEAAEALQGSDYYHHADGALDRLRYISQAMELWS